MPNRSSFAILAATVAAGVAVIVVALSPQVRAGPPPRVTLLDPASVLEAGRTIDLPLRTIGGITLVEPVGPADGPPALPLAAAPDGRAVVVSTVGGGQVGPLTIARADGAQLEIALPGVRGAAFHPTGAWLVTVDLAGALWRIEAETGAATRLAEGPFGSAPTVLADGRILAIRLSSVDAPAWSAGVTVDPATGAETQVAHGENPQDQLVYQATALADRSIALVRHQAAGGVALVRVGPDGSEALLLDLPDATLVAVSPDAQWVAWVAAGVVHIGRTGPLTDVRNLGAGTGARFSPDGSLLLVFVAGGAQIVDLDGNRLAAADASACWLGDGRGCRP
ncbi:MAG: hypothetical protein ACRDFZ_03055 [Candidatus Limnocylindria bacterium]